MHVVEHQLKQRQETSRNVDLLKRNYVERARNKFGTR